MQDAGNNNRPSTGSGIGYWYVLGPALRQAHGPVENNTMWGPELVEGAPTSQLHSHFVASGDDIPRRIVSHE
jgi:hypothetical protein